VSSQAAALGCSAEVDWMQEALPYYPPTVNDPEAYKFAADVATRCGRTLQHVSVRPGGHVMEWQHCAWGGGMPWIVVTRVAQSLCMKVLWGALICGAARCCQQHSTAGILAGSSLKPPLSSGQQVDMLQPRLPLSRAGLLPVRHQSEP
jgi:hypothetical protein